MVIMLLAIVSFSTPLQAIEIERCNSEQCQQYFKSFKKAAQRGYAQAAYMLAKFYQNGYGTDQNIAKAITYYRKAATKGRIVEAQFKLGFLYLTDKEHFDEQKALKWLEVAADKNHPNALFVLGDYYFTQGDYRQADEWLAKAYQQQQVDLPRWIQFYQQHQQLPTELFPKLYHQLAERPLVALKDNTLAWNDSTIERIRITAPSLQIMFDDMLADFKGKLSSTGTRLGGITCANNVACQQKSLNEMKDSIWVSQK